MNVVKVRFNTKAGDDDPLKWRVLIDDVEHLADAVVFTCNAITTRDTLPTGEVKYHLTGVGTVEWHGQTAVIK